MQNLKLPGDIVFRLHMLRRKNKTKRAPTGFVADLLYQKPILRTDGYTAAEADDCIGAGLFGLKPRGSGGDRSGFAECKPGLRDWGTPNQYLPA